VDLGEWAAKIEDALERMQSSLAVDVVVPQAIRFVEIEQMVTPHKTGALARSEFVSGHGGGGTHAVALAGPHKVYAEIQNDGGTITKHGPGSLGNPAVGWYGHSVQIRGKGYVQKAEGAAEGELGDIAGRILAFYLDF
jgi:hypothetical protein